MLVCLELGSRLVLVLELRIWLGIWLDFGKSRIMSKVRVRVSNSARIRFLARAWGRFTARNRVRIRVNVRVRDRFMVRD